MSVITSKNKPAMTAVLEVRSDLTNKGESKNFLRTALAVKGSASPAVTRRVVFTAFFSLLCSTLFHHYPQVAIPITPF